MALDDTLLYPQIHTPLGPHQKSFLLQQMVTNAETHNWTVCREGETLGHSALNQMFLYQSLPLKDQGTMWKRRWKDYKHQRWWITPRKQHILDTTGLTHTWEFQFCGSMHRPCRSSTKPNPSMKKKKQMQNSTSNQESICILYLMPKKKISFLQWRVIGYTNHTPGPAPYPGVVGPIQNRIHVSVCALSVLF